MQNEEKKQSEIYDKNIGIDFECSICMMIMVEPYRLICGHRICVQCVNLMLIQSESQYIQCPVCRQNSEIQQPVVSIEKEYQNVIAQFQPIQFIRRKKEISQTFGLVEDQKVVEFEIGNYHAPYVEGKVKTQHWTAFVRLKENHKISKFVEKVEFKLHPSFGLKKPIVIFSDLCNDHNKVNFDRPDEISISYKGWGAFVIPITIYFDKSFYKEPVRVYYTLSFQNGGSIQKCPILINEKYLRELAKNEESKIEPAKPKYKILCFMNHESEFIFGKTPGYRIFNRTDCNECRQKIFLFQGYFHCGECTFDLCLSCSQNKRGKTFTKQLPLKKDGIKKVWRS